MSPMTEPLTTQQQRVYDFIVCRIEQEHLPPTVREIADYLGIVSTNGANDFLRVLVRKGYIIRPPGKARAIRLVLPAVPPLLQLTPGGAVVLARLAHVRLIPQANLWCGHCGLDFAHAGVLERAKVQAFLDEHARCEAQGVTAAEWLAAREETT